MANPIKGEVTLDAGAASYKVVFDFNAICSLEDEFDVHIENIGALIEERAGHLRRVLKAGLGRHHADLSDFDVGDIITTAGPAAVGEVVTKAFQLAFPEAEDSAGKPKPARKSRARR